MSASPTNDPTELPHQPAIATSSVVTTPRGVATALGAYTLWGFFPLYFKQLADYDAVEIIGHRVIWSFVFVLLLLVVRRHWQWLGVVRREPKWLLYTLISGTIIATNWLTYVWAVNHNHMLEASLGYFISPLAGVLLALVVLQERLRPLQWLAIGLALVGVGVQLLLLGKLPWVTLLLAATFSVYGLMHRRTPLDALSAMFIETALLVPACVVWFWQADVASSHVAFWLSPSIWLLMLAGPITLIPLLMYNKSTKMVAFSLLSFLNYLSPTIVFLLAVLVYHEAFDSSRLITFGCIWLGLIFFSYDLFKQRKH